MVNSYFGKPFSRSITLEIFKILKGQTYDLTSFFENASPIVFCIFYCFLHLFQKWLLKNLLVLF